MRQEADYQVSVPQEHRILRPHVARYGDKGPFEAALQLCEGAIEHRGRSF